MPYKYRDSKSIEDDRLQEFINFCAPIADPITAAINREWFCALDICSVTRRYDKEKGYFYQLGYSDLYGWGRLALFRRPVAEIEFRMSQTCDQHDLVVRVHQPYGTASSSAFARPIAEDSEKEMAKNIKKALVDSDGRPRWISKWRPRIRAAVVKPGSGIHLTT